MKKILLVSFLIIGCNAFSQNIENKAFPKLGQAEIKQIITAMTLEEKVNMVVGAGGDYGFSSENQGAIGEIKEQVTGAAGSTTNIPRLGIKSIIMADGPAGVRIDPIRNGNTKKTYYATAWPIGTLLASSWDTTLVKKVGNSFGNEVKEYGIDIILAPGANIQRNPLNGRNFEYYSEDPFLSGFIASSLIKGIQSNGVGTSLKHFACNNQESNRTNVDAIVSQRALREIYLRSFEIAVKNAHPWTVMSAYNKINGTYCSENYDLLTKILRNDWGFTGFVITDWFAGKNPVLQMMAGNDLIMPGMDNQKTKIIEAVKTGKLEEKVLDKNIEHILAILLKTPSNNHYSYSDAPNLIEHAKISRLSAAESMVLLKNNNTLPLQNGSKIALFGTASYHTYIGGTGSGSVNVKDSVSISRGLSNAGYKLAVNLAEIYNNHIKNDEANHPKPKLTLGTPRLIPELELTKEQIKESINEANIVVFTIGRNAGEGADRKLDNNFNLSDYESNLIQELSNISHAQNKKLVVLINSGGVIETASWKDRADAIVLVWQPGQEAGNAIADILGGKINPSGKLATTFPVKYEDVPSSKNFPGLPPERPKQVMHTEGIYVGYRYFNSFGIKTSYPFGYGLSYTTFAYSNLKLSPSSFNDQMKVSVMIQNTGKFPGKEVVQLYLSAPSGRLDKPSEELKGFSKTRLLKPGEVQTLIFTLNLKDLASFDSEQSAWIADAGNYEVKIGASSEDIKLNKSFNLKTSRVVEKVSNALAPQQAINELKK